MKQGRDNYNRLYELLGLINAMRGSPGGLTYDDIQNRFGWERKTVERMLKLVENTYWNSFIKERGGNNKIFCRLSRGDVFPPMCISEREVVALRTVLGIVKTNEPLKLPLESLAGKLESLQNNAAAINIEDMTLASGTASAPRPCIKLDRKILETLQTAILAYRVVKIKYRRARLALHLPPHAKNHAPKRRQPHSGVNRRRLKRDGVASDNMGGQHQTFGAKRVD